MGHPNENQLILDIKENQSSESFLIMKERFGAIFTRVLSYYQPHLTNCGLDGREMASEIDHVLFKAILSFDSNKKVKFSTYFWNSCKFFFLKLLAKHGRKNFILMDNEVIFDLLCQKAEETGKTPVLNYLQELINDFEDDRMRKVFEARYLQDKKSSWSVVAKKANVSKDVARKLNSKGIKILSRKLKSEKVLA